MKKSLVVLMALAACLLVSASTAHAAMPLDVDCDLLEATNDSVNDILDMAGVQFNNLGDLFSVAILDEDVFDQLNALVIVESGGLISFDSATQGIATEARCGLIPQLIGAIRD